MKIHSGLRRRRQLAGLTQLELSGRADLSRQRLSVLESGQTAPSTAVALRLAAILGCRVEDLFWIEEEPGEILAELAGEGRAPARGRGSESGARVVLGLVKDRWVAHRLHPDDPSSLTVAADALIATERAPGERVRVRPLGSAAALRNNLLVCGCDPALGILAARAAQGAEGLRPIWVPAASDAALKTLARGHAHLAGAHLFDEDAREHNVPFVRRAFPGRAMLVVTLADIEEGFAVPKGNPRRIRKPEDLARPDVRLINREPGAGARRLLDRVLRKAGIQPGAVEGYERLARGHLQVAQQVASGAADVGVVARSAALAYGLDFVPLAEERFDLVLPREASDDPRVARFLETLQGRAFRRELAAVGGYDASHSGDVVAEIGVAPAARH